jgi:lipopolysaccharide assembly outer membrane protein LptD (OstA)
VELSREQAKIKTGDRVRVVSPTLRLKNFPVFYLPYASVSIKTRDRASGFLTPTFGGSGAKGFRLSTAYYQTLGRSADFTFRSDVYTQRGLGFGGDLRTRANSRSYLNAGFYAVKDRIFGPEASAANPDQGGSSLYVDGVHYFKNGFIAAADVNVTSNLAFRQIFLRQHSTSDFAGRDVAGFCKTRTTTNTASTFWRERRYVADKRALRIRQLSKHQHRATSRPFSVF